MPLFLLHQSPCVGAEDSPAGAALTTFDHFDETNGTLVFAAPAGTTPPKPLKSNLVDVKYLGSLHPPTGEPYFILSAKACRTCLDEQAIFTIRADNQKPTAFVYPGKIFDPKSRALLLESRSFFGKCLPSRGDLYIVFQQERVDRRSKLQSSVLVEEAAAMHLNETLTDHHSPQLRTVLQQVKKKLCREVEGRNRLMLTRPLDLHPNSKLGDEDEEEKNDEVKNELKDEQS